MILIICWKQFIYLFSGDNDIIGKRLKYKNTLGTEVPNQDLLN